MSAYYEAVVYRLRADLEDWSWKERLEADYAEMKALYELKLGHEIDDESAKASFSVQIELRGLQEYLVQIFDKGFLSDDEYTSRVEELLTASMIQNRALLGTSDFTSIFGDGVQCAGISQLT